MSTDDTNRHLGRGEEPVVIGSALRDVEARLRTALREDADGVGPAERLDAILAAAHAGVPLSTVDSPARRRWLMPAAAAAAAAVVVGAIWVAGRPDPTPLVPGATASSTVSSTVSTTPSTPTTQLPTSSAPGPSSSQASGPTTGTTLPPTALVTVPRQVPVYYVGDRVPGGTSLALFREFVSAPVTSPVTDETRALAALQQAAATPAAGSGYQGLWAGVEVQAVSVTSSRITVTLSRGVTGVGGESAKLAVQQLVWTAQGAVGKGLIPVTFVLADGGTEVAPGLSTSTTYTQPSSQDAFAEISTIWVDDPAAWGDGQGRCAGHRQQEWPRCSRRRSSGSCSEAPPLSPRTSPPRPSERRVAGPTRSTPRP